MNAKMVMSVGVVVAASVVSSAFGLDAAAQCESKQLMMAARYDFCRLRAASSAIKQGVPPDFSTCDAAFTSKWAQTQSSAGGAACPSAADPAAMRSLMSGQTDDVARTVHGGAVPDCAGDLAACDASLDTCSASLSACLAQPGAASQPLQTGQVSCYDASGALTSCAGTGQDGELHNGLGRVYLDNADGTITDTRSGLTWEKLSADGGIHDKDTAYRWSDATATKIAALNSASFAGHSDWRLPNVTELLTLPAYGDEPIDPAFSTPCTPGCTVTAGSCIRAAFYWSSTTAQINASSAWGLSFDNGFMYPALKSTAGYVRAVRGGT
jgi:hypothetical protein